MVTITTETLHLEAPAMNQQLVKLSPAPPPVILEGALRARLVAAFLEGRNERTMRTYQQGLADFAAFVGVQSVEEAANVLITLSAGEANGLVLRYRSHLVDAGKAAATVNNRLAAVRSLVKLARTLGLVSWQLEIQGLKSETYRDTRGPGPGGYRRVLDATDLRTDAKGLRDRAIVRLLYELALRRLEVVRLDVADVDLESGAIQVLGKGRSGKVRMTLPDTTRAALSAWLEVRGTEPGPLFLNLDRASSSHEGRRLSPTSVNRILAELGSRLGFQLRPHGLRHAAITQALELTNGNYRAVARFSRHRDIRVLNVYDDNREDLGGSVARLVAGSV